MNSECESPVFHYIPEGKPSEFWIVTAWKSGGTGTSVAENKARDSELRQILQARNLQHFRVITTSADENRGEPSWGIVSDEGTATALGRQFSQASVFHIQMDAGFRICCRSFASTPLSGLEALVRDPRDVRLFTISVGAPVGGKFGDEDLQCIHKAIQSLFPGYSIRRADGCFENQFEEVLLIDIGTREYLRVLRLADELRIILKQKGVGITCNGIYQRVREWTDDGLILDSFGLDSLAGIVSSGCG